MGANLGDRRAALDDAVRRLTNDPEFSSVRESGSVASAAVGGPSGQPEFVNSAVAVQTDLEPLALLARLQAIESSSGRTRSERWGARPLDIDLLTYGEVVLRTDRLRLPHPRMTFRPFVLAPAAELAPDWRHPELGASLGDLLAALRDGDDRLAIVGHPTDPRRAASAVAGLIAIDAPDGVRCIAEGDSHTAAKLTIDLRDEIATPIGPTGPRLMLTDCPRAHWRDEVRAAIRCVWPPP